MKTSVIFEQIHIDTDSNSMAFTDDDDDSVSVPPERDEKDFRFKQLSKIRVSETPANLPLDKTSLVAVANNFGLVFVGSDVGFKVLKTTSIIEGSIGQPVNKVVEDFDFWAVVNIQTKPSHISVNADNSALAVSIDRNTVAHILLFDIRAFANKGSQVSPFFITHLTSTPGCSVSNLLWNPTTPSLIAICLTDGSLSLWTLADQVTRIANLGREHNFTAICWSPKGKQLVAGKQDGTLTQYDQKLEVKANIARPADTFQVTDVLWASTNVFIASYVPLGDDSTIQPTVVITTTSKTAPPKFVSYEDISYGSDEERIAGYLFTQILEWEMVVGVSQKGQEVGILGRGIQDKNLWEMCSLEDSGRAELPLTDDQENTFPMGLGIDFTSQYEIPIGENKTYEPSPILYVLSTDGVLCPCYMMFDGRPNLTRPPQPIPPGVRQPGSVQLAPNSQIGGIPPPVPQAAAQVSPPKPLMPMPPPFGAPTATAPGFTFGNTASKPPFSFADKPAFSFGPTSAASSVLTEPPKSAGFALDATAGSTGLPSSNPAGSFTAPPPKAPSGFSFAAGQTSLTTPVSITTPSPGYGGAVPTPSPGYGGAVPKTGFTFGAASASMVPPPPPVLPASTPSPSLMPGVPKSSGFAFGMTPPASTPSPSIASGMPSFSAAPKDLSLSSFGVPGGKGTTPTLVGLLANQGKPGAGLQLGLTEPQQPAAPPRITEPLTMLQKPNISASTVQPKPVIGTTSTSNTRPSLPSPLTSQGLSQTTGSGFSFVSPKASPAVPHPVVARPQAPPQQLVTKPSISPQQMPVANRPLAMSNKSQNRPIVMANKDPSPNRPIATAQTSGRPISMQVKHQIRTPPMKPSGGPTLQQTVASAKQAGSTNPFIQSILDETFNFQKELDELKTQTGPRAVNIGTGDEMLKIKKRIKDMNEFCEEIKENAQCMNKEVNTLKSECLEIFAQVEECKMKSQRNSRPEYLQLLRSKSLDPASARTMHEIHQLYHYLDNGLRDVNSVLDADWEKYQAKRKGMRKRLQSPASDSIYRTLSCTTNVISDQERRLEQVMKQLKGMKLFNTTSSWEASTPTRGRKREEGAISSPVTAMMEQIMTPCKVSPPQVSPLKQAKLREILGRRKITPVKSTAPANLSMSKIVSAEALSRMLSSSQSSIDEYEEEEEEESYEDEESDTVYVPEGLMGLSEAQMRAFLPQLLMQSTPNKPTQQLMVDVQDATEGLPRPYKPAVNVSGKGTITYGNPPKRGEPRPQQIVEVAYPGLDLTQDITSPVRHDTSKPALPANVSVGKQILSAVTPHAMNIANMSDKDKFLLTQFKSFANIPTNAQAGVNVTLDKPVAVHAKSADAVKPVLPSAARNLPEVEDITPPSTPPAEGKSIEPSKPVVQPSAAKSLFNAPSSKTAFVPPKPDAKTSFGGGSYQASSPVSGPGAISGYSTMSTTMAFGTRPTSSFSFGDPRQNQVQSSASSGGGFGFGLTAPSSSAGNTDGKQVKPSSVTPTPDVSSTTPTPPTGTGFKFNTEGPAASGFSFGKTAPATTGFLFGKPTESSTATSVVKTPAETPTPPPSGADFSFAQATKDASSAVSQISPKAPTPTSNAEVTGISTSGGSKFLNQTTTTASSGAPKTSFSFVKAAGTSPSLQPTSLFGGLGLAAKTATSSASGDAGQEISATTAAATLPISTTPVEATTKSLFGGTSGFSFTKPPTSGSGFAFSQPSSGQTTSLFGGAATVSSTQATVPTQPAASSASPVSAGLTLPAATPTVAGTSVSQGPTTALDTTTSAAPSSTSTTTTVTTTTSSSSLGLFGSKAGSAAPFGSTGTGLFGQPASSSSTGLFGQSTASSTAVTSASEQPKTSPFGQPATEQPKSSIFGQPVTSPTAAAGDAKPLLFGAKSDTSASVFGKPASLGFGQTSSPSVFGQAASTSSSVFGSSASASSVFGKPASTTATSSSGFGSAPAFGQTTSSASSTFGGSGSVFGQASSAGFGGGFGKPTFGQSTASPSQTSTGSAFGQSSSVFGQTATSSSGSAFGGSSDAFGLGGKPNPENVNKNVFGTTTSFGESGATGNLFGGSGATAFGSKEAAKPAGPFSGAMAPQTGGPFSGAMASQTGGPFSSPSGPTSAFGGGGFGGSPSFGSGPAFGSPPAFGSAAGFGSQPVFGGQAPAAGNVQTAKVFGSTSPVAGGFASLANQSSPTFGSMPSQPAAPTFGSVAAFGAVAGQPAAFGSVAGQPAAFGAVASQLAAPSFGSVASQPGAPTFGSVAQQSPSGFGALGQQSPGGFGSPPAFGGSAGGFGGNASGSVFGSPQAPKQASFTSYRS